MVKPPGFEDANSLREYDDGHFHLGVHADVSYYVTERTRMDVEAFVAGRVYCPERALPMLPEVFQPVSVADPQVDRGTSRH